MKATSKTRILVVDDDIVTLKIVCEMLKSMGHEATAAQDGSKALSLMAIHDGFHLVLTDINMPEMDGWELAQRLRKDNCLVPIIALTGENPSNVMPHLKESGISHALFKPIIRDELQEALALVLDPERTISDRGYSSVKAEKEWLR